jgi:hypothetical protein
MMRRATGQKKAPVLKGAGPVVNVSCEVKDQKLVLTVDVSKAKLDEAGKMRFLATTNGWVMVGSVGVSLNVIVR